MASKSKDCTIDLVLLKLGGKVTCWCGSSLEVLEVLDKKEQLAFSTDHWDRL